MASRRAVLLPLLFLTMGFQSPSGALNRHFEAAERESKAGNSVRAEAEYSAVLAEAYDGLGNIFSAEKRYKDAVAAFISAADYGAASEQHFVDLSIAYFDSGQYQKAFDPLSKALAVNPRSAGARQMMGKSYFMLGEFEKATSELESARKLAPGDFEVAYTLGLAYLKQRQYDPAKKIYDEMLAQLGDKPQLHIVFGRAYRETGFLAQAIDEFKKAIALDPKFPRAHYYLGLTYLLKDGAPRLNDAADEFKIELLSHPDQFFANYYLGVVYLIQRKWDLAISFLEKASRAESKNPDPYFHLGQAYQAVGKQDLAIEVLKKSIALNPDLGHNDYQVTTAHYRLGQSLLKTGKREEGEKELQLASQLKAEAFKRDEEKQASYQGQSTLNEQHKKFEDEAPPAEGIIAESSAPDAKTKEELKSSEDYYSKVVATAHENIGLLRAGRQDFSKAAEQFSLAAKWNPELERIYFNWGLAAFKGGQYKEAIVPLEKELNQSPSNVAAKQLLGMSYFATEDFAKASGLLKDVLAAKPGESSLYYPLAVCLLKQGKMDEADEVIKKMMTVGANSPQIHILMAQAYQEQGDSTRALEELDSALALDGKIPLAHYYSGLIYIKLGKMDNAAREFEAELAIKPNEVEARYHLAFVMLESQKIQTGLELMREVIKEKPDYADARYELGKTLLQQGDVKGAVENLEMASKLKPEEPYVHYQLGRAYLAAGRKEEGNNQLEVFKQLKDKTRNEPHQ